jgi:uncharacterized RDD family membrane protein YckC
LATTEFASRTRRSFALALDLFFCVWILIAAAAIVDMVFDRRLGWIATIALVVAYFVLSTASKWQGTPGKRLMGIKVADIGGGRIGIGRAALRAAATLLSIATFGVGFAVAFWDRKRRALHDFIAGTVVADRQATPEAIAQSQPPMPSLPARIGKTALLLLIFGLPIAIYEYPMHGGLARQTNNQNFAETALVVAALDAYKQKNGRYPQSLRDLHPGFLGRLPNLDRSVLTYSVSATGDQCWLAIVYWMAPGFFMPSDMVNEYDCSARKWQLMDYSQMTAQGDEAWRELTKKR